MVEVITDLDEQDKLKVDVRVKSAKDKSVYTLSSGGFELGILALKNGPGEESLSIIHFGKPDDRILLAVHFDEDGEPATDESGNVLVEGFDSNTILPHPEVLSAEFLQEKQQQLKQFIDLITLGQDSSPKTKYGSRRWFLRTAAASASGVILSACAPEDRALDEGKKQALEGTPTPKPESKISHELIRKNLFLLSVMSTNENEWYTYGSSGFIKGEVINRPDLIIMTTARHVMIGDDGLPRFMNTTLTFQNGITGTNCEISSEKSKASL